MKAEARSHRTPAVQYMSTFLPCTVHAVDHMERRGVHE